MKFRRRNPSAYIVGGEDQTGCRQTHKEVFTVIQIRDDGSLDQNNGNGSREKSMGSREV